MAVKGNPWIENLIRPLAVGAMFGCIVAALVGVARLFSPQWNATYLVVSGVLAAIEANYSYRIIRSRRLSGGELWRFRLSELLLFLIVLKIASYVGDPWSSVWADLRSWPRRPLNILDTETLVAFVLVIVSWAESTDVTMVLEQLAQPRRIERGDAAPLDELTHRFFLGGALLFIASGTRVGLVEWLDLPGPSPLGLALNALLYFLLGLLILGQAAYITLQDRWEAAGMKAPDVLAVRWIRYTLLLFALAGVLAILLPTRYTVDLLDLIALAVGIIAFVGMLIVTLIVLPFALLINLLSGRSTQLPDLGRSLPQLPGDPPGPAGPTSNWLQVLRSLVFWAVLIGIVVYVIRAYLRDHPELVQALARFSPVRFLARLLSVLRGRLAGAGRAAGRLRHLFARRSREQGAAEEPFRLFRLGRLPPRERILYYYLSILERAREQGLPREQDQTPYEYDTALKPNLPEAEEEMSELTDAFVEARYSRHSFDPTRDREIRARWRRVRTMLRALRRERTESDRAEGERGDPGA